MRFSIVLLLGSLLFVSAGFAAEDGASTSRDGYFLQNGKVMTYRDGTMFEARSEVMFKNGTRILTDGTLIRPDGTRTYIGNEFVTRDGEMNVRTHRENARDISHDRSNNYTNSQATVPKSSCCESHHTPALTEDEKYENSY